MAWFFSLHFLIVQETVLISFVWLSFQILETRRKTSNKSHHKGNLHHNHFSSQTISFNEKPHSILIWNLGSLLTNPNWKIEGTFQSFYLQRITTWMTKKTLVLVFVPEIDYQIPAVGNFMAAMFFCTKTKKGDIKNINWKAHLALPG